MEPTELQAFAQWITDNYTLGHGYGGMFSPEYSTAFVRPEQLVDMFQSRGQETTAERDASWNAAKQRYAAIGKAFRIHRDQLIMNHAVKAGEQ